MNQIPDRTPNSRLLARLAEHTDMVEVHGGRFRVKEQIDTPYNEFGIVDKHELFRRILGSVSTVYHWQGSYVGPHHLMWPRADYLQASTNHNKTPMLFRDGASLQIILRRELHDWAHMLAPQPVMPAMDVMRQHHHEQRQLMHLYGIIRFHGLRELNNMNHEQKEAYRLRRFHDLLDKMDDGQVGLMPDREMLANLPLTDARQVVRSLARVQGLSNDPSCQSAFFARSAPDTM